jgi:hypothetical protein
MGIGNSIVLSYNYRYINVMGIQIFHPHCITVNTQLIKTVFGE